MKKGLVRSYRGKLLISFTAALLLPTLILSIVYYYVGADTAQKNARRVYSEMLNQAIGVVDDSFGEIENLANVYSSTGWVKTILYMQGSQINYSRLSMYTLFEYGDVVKRVESTNSVISQSALVFVEKSAAMLDNGLWPLRAMLLSAIPLPGMTPEEAAAAIADNEGTTYLYPVTDGRKQVRYSLPSEDEYLCMIIEIPSVEKKKAAQVVVRIDLVRIRRLLNEISDLPLCIFRPDGQELVSNSAWNAIDGGGTGDEITVDGEKYLLFTDVSPLNGWRYVSYVSRRGILSGVAAVRNIILIVCAALLAAGIVLALILTRRTYMPIRQLSEKWLTAHPQDPDRGHTDALDMLEDTFRRLSERSETLGRAADEYQPLAREAYFSRLISAVIPADDVVPLASMLNVDLQCRVWIAALFAFVPDLTAAMERRLAETGGYVVHIGAGRLLLILGGGSAEECCGIMRDLSARTGASVGISQAHVDIGEMSDAYMEACIALEFAADGGASTYAEAVSHSIAYEYAPEDENALANALRAADYEQARARIGDAVDKNRGVNPISMRCLLYNMLSTMFRIGRADGLELPGGTDDYVLARGNDELKTALLKVARGVCRAEGERVRRSGTGEEMVRFVRENFRRPDLSLTQLAEHFGVSSQYASRAYKSSSGMNFLDSLMRLRVDCAKDLMRRRDLTQEELCRAAGFDSVTTFRRTFKRLEGITPGEWRETQVFADSHVKTDG